MYVLVVFGILSFLSIGYQFVKEEKERREENLIKFKVKIMYDAYYDESHNIVEYNDFLIKVQAAKDMAELDNLYNSYFVA